MTKYKYTSEELRIAVSESVSVSEVMRRLGIKHTVGGNHAYIKGRIRNEGIDTSHFLGRGWESGPTSSKRLTWQDVLVKNRTKNREIAYKLRRALDEYGMRRVCNKCGIEEVWQGLPLVLEINHINEDCLDNRPENLEYLCPNCHQQKTFLSSSIGRKQSAVNR